MRRSALVGGVRLIAFIALVTLLLGSYTSFTGIGSDFIPSLEFLATSSTRPPPTSCSPQAYNDGLWTRNPAANMSTDMRSTADALHHTGFSGCASSREYDWHLGEPQDPEQRWKWPAVASYVWTPNRENCALRPMSSEALLKDLVENGGWLFIGDSITEGHFFSLSCALHPHVTATPDYTNEPYWDRAWQQDLWLNPESPLIPYLKLPPGFDFKTTPLATFRRVDLLLTGKDLSSLHRKLYNPPADFNLFNGSDYYGDLGPAEYVPILTDPTKHYSTMIVSTAGHWTPNTFAGLLDDKVTGKGINAVLDLYEPAMAQWAHQVQGMLDADHASSRSLGMKRRVVIRSYLPGHSRCHSFPWFTRPWSTDFGYNRDHNWPYIAQFNDILDNTVQNMTDIHYLGIDRPGRLRPDGHVTGDCLHIMTGIGIMEGWTHYIWHYLSTELDKTISPVAGMEVEDEFY